MYSVLMSVYYKENPEHLRQAMDSMWSQTLPPEEFVLVCDGPLNEPLDEVIAEMQQLHPQLNVVRLEQNVGLGRALNEGIRHCKCDLIARMDSDDIARPERCEKEEKALLEHNADIVSAWVEEFSERPEEVNTRRVLPETHEEILRFSQKRNPFNHPCVMYRKSAVESAGGYQDFYLLEDYYLWMRMLLNGSKGYNIQESLLWMRAGNALYKRRAGWKYAKSQRALFRYMKQNKMINSAQYFTSCAIRTASAISPNWLRQMVFQKVLRK